MAEEKQKHDERQKHDDKQKIDDKQKQIRKPQEEPVRGSVNFSMAWPAKVEEIIERTGTRGEATQVRCRIMEGRDKNKVLRRNVRGPIQIGDVLDRKSVV